MVTPARGLPGTLTDTRRETRPPCGDRAPRTPGTATCADSSASGLQDRAIRGREGALTSAQFLRHPSKRSRDPKIAVSLCSDRSPQQKSDPLVHVHRHRRHHTRSGRNPNTTPPPTQLPTNHPSTLFHPARSVRRGSRPFRCRRAVGRRGSDAEGRATQRRQPVHPGPRTGRPGSAPVWTPSATTATPFTNTCSMPVES